VALFGGRALVVVAVAFGPALLGFGPRASAAFLPTQAGPSQSASAGAADQPFAARESAPKGQRPDVWPPVNNPHHVPQVAHHVPAGSPSGCGVPPSSSPSGPTATALGPVGDAFAFAPQLLARLRTFPPVCVLPLLTPAIFEPPRARG
jgi:hypothetical protein